MNSTSTTSTRTGDSDPRAARGPSRRTLGADAQARGLFGRAVQIGAVLAILAGPTFPASAQPGAPRTEPTAAQRETARSLMNEGARQYREGDYQDALRSFQAADGIVGAPTTGFFVAKAQEKLGQLVEALDTLARVRNHPEALNEPPPFKQARELARALVADISERTPSLEVALVGLPTDATAEVTIDGVSFAPDLVRFPNKLNPGPHYVAVFAPGFIGPKEHIVLQEGEKRRLEMEVQPQAIPRPKPRPQRKSKATEESTAIPLEAWAAFGLGAGGLLVGTVAGAVALSLNEDLKDVCPGDGCKESEHQSDQDRLAAAAHISTAGFVTAGVGAATGLILTLTSSNSTTSNLAPDQADDHAVTIRPVLGLGTAALVGRF